MPKRKNLILTDPGTTIADVLNMFDHDFDYVSYRIPLNPDDFAGETLTGCENTEFAGAFRTKDKEIISLDHDTYSKGETVLAIEEWSMIEKGIRYGLSVIVDAELVPTGEFFANLS